MRMPVGSAVKDTGIFSPISYYQLSVPVVALPRALNEEAMRVGSRFSARGSTAPRTLSGPRHIYRRMALSSGSQTTLQECRSAS